MLTIINIRLIRLHIDEHETRISYVVRETSHSRNTLTLLNKETAKKVDLDALNKLYELFNCPLSYLLEHIPY